MRNRKNQYRVVIATLAFLLLTLVVTNIIFLNNNQLLKDQVELRDSTINENLISDSILCEQMTKNEHIINKYIYDCGILINGKEVTTEELLTYIQKRHDDIDTLVKQINKINDSLKVYKTFYNLTKENLKVDFSVSYIDDGKVVILEVPKDTLSVYKRLYELAKTRYGFEYIQERKNNDLMLIHQFTKVDSAMMIYDYYKDKLIKDENGDWMIIIEKTVKK